MITYFTVKLTSMIGGLFGGSTILTFIRPKTIREAFMRGGISTGSAIIFVDPIINKLGTENTMETQLMYGFTIGFFAYSVLGMIANFLIKNENKTIIEVIKEVKGEIK